MNLMHLRRWAWLGLSAALALSALPAAAQPATQELAQAPAAKPAAASLGANHTVTVTAGDSGTALALRYKPAGATLEQSLVALWRANPRAFGDGNLNLLREGATLRIPSTEDVLSVPAAEARTLAIEQVEHVQAFVRQQLGAAKSPSPAQPAPQSAAASAPVAASNPDSAKTEQLGRALQDALALKQALERQTRDAESHLVQLEQTIRELQRLNPSTAPADAASEASSAPAADAPAAAQPTSASAPSTPRSAARTFSLTLTEPQLWVAGLGLFVVIGGLVLALRRRRPQRAPHTLKQIEIPAAMARIDLNLDSPPSSGADKTP